jgi:hypothetical protein
MSVEFEISMGSQSENQVFMAVGVRLWDRTPMTCAQISFIEFMAFPFLSG